MKRALRGDDGASAVEYSLLVVAIAAIIVLVVFALGTFVKGSFKDTCDNLNQVPINAATGGAASNCNS